MPSDTFILLQLRRLLTVGIHLPPLHHAPHRRLTPRTPQLLTDRVLKMAGWYDDNSGYSREREGLCVIGVYRLTMKSNFRPTRQRR